MNEPEQLDLLDRSGYADGMPPSVPVDTSEAAAESMVPTVRGKRAAVLHLIERVGIRGITDEEIQHRLGWNPSTSRPRRIELVRLGLVASDGTKRMNRSGRMSRVWRRTSKPVR